MASEPRLICVTGADGAGKTTQIARLAQRLEREEKLKVAVATIWDLLLDPATAKKVRFESPQQVDDYLSVLGPTARALFLYHCFYQALELASKRQSDVVLLNAYWYKYYSTEVAHGGDPARLERLAEVFPEPALTFILRVDPAQAARRKAGKFSGYESGFPAKRTEEAFVAFQRRAEPVLERLAAERGWAALDGVESADALTSRILAAIS